jgi:two-component system alkaline phosphatase synthesis response regulator PhoP/two-component system response regulator ResD
MGLAMAATILVVDDEPNITQLLKLYLSRSGFQVETAANGEEALRKTRSLRPDLIVLDLKLPDIDGLEVCRRVRAESDIPLIMLTARDEDIDKIVGLEMGADDYITKPFNPREVLARVRAVLRRSEGRMRADGPIRVGDLVVDTNRREAFIGDQPIQLRAKEFDLLATLARNAGIVLDRDRLLNQVWGYDFTGDTRTVDVHIAWLRQKLAGSRVEIQTVRGAGYKLVVRE